MAQLNLERALKESLDMYIRQRQGLPPREEAKREEVKVVEVEEEKMEEVVQERNSDASSMFSGGYESVDENDQSEQEDDDDYEMQASQYINHPRGVIERTRFLARLQEEKEEESKLKDSQSDNFKQINQLNDAKLKDEVMANEEEKVEEMK